MLRTARSRGCSRGQPKHERKHCPVCGTLAIIRRDHRSCSRVCGFQPRCRKCHRHHDGAIGEGNPRATLTDQRVRELRARPAEGLTYRQLATEFDISDVSAWAAVDGETWRHIA
jgi:hypothetical protein